MKASHHNPVSPKPRFLSSLFTTPVHFPFTTALVIGVLAVLSVSRVATSLESIADITKVVLVVAVTLVTMLEISRNILSRRVERELEVLISSAGTPRSPTDIDFIDFVAAQIDGMVAREKLTMIRAERDVRWLSSIGSTLTVASVLAPIAAAWLYASLEPVSPSTIEALVNLKTRIGFVPNGEQLILQRDWHLLLAGLSLGFLFLAAARGVLRLESRNRQVFLGLSQRVGYFERLASVLRINVRLASESDERSKLAVAALLKMLDNVPTTTAPAIEPEEQSSTFKEQVEAVASVFSKEK